jgi:transcriptional regulator with XRE-family HTH domain
MAGIAIHGAALKQAREARRQSQDEFAEDCGFTRFWLSSMELGKEKPSLRTLDKLAGVLGADVVAGLIVRPDDRATFRGEALAPQAAGPDGKIETP